MQPIRTRENPEAKRLWGLSKTEFNAWRRSNDLPLLLNFLKEALPHFSEWQTDNAITDVNFLVVDHTSHLLIGDGTRYLIDATQPSQEVVGLERSSFVSEMSGAEIVARRPPRYEFQLHSSNQFTPYFHWLKTNRKLHLFRIPNDPNNAFTSDLTYMAWQGGDLAFSRASLFYSHRVLKMGGVNVRSSQLDGRNLDFVDLDGLVITRSGWARTTRIAYSSCRWITFINADKSFLRFEKCALEYLRVKNSTIYGLDFVSCTLMEPTFEDSKLSQMSLVKTAPGRIRFENCELYEFTFRDPPKNMPFDHRSDFYKRLRSAYQQKGNRVEARACYYQERLNELLSHFSPLIPYDPRLPRRGWVGGYRDLFERRRAGQYTGRQVLRWVLGNLFAYVQLVILPHHLVRFLYSKFRAIPEIIDFALWGFGERPMRVFPWMVGVLLAFSAKYYYGPNPELRGNALESFYCSAFNFATIGCEHKTSFDSIEAVLGATLLGIMVAGFANRTRY